MSTGGQEPQDAAGGTQPTLVVEHGDEDASGPAVQEPAKLLRIASMVRALIDEVRSADLNEAGRERLTEIHNRSLEMLREIVSDDLAEELTQVALSELEDAPSTSELRVAQAQLRGWLEGLFHGIQATIASQQMSAQQQLEQMRRQGALPPGAQQGEPQPGRQEPGQYL